MHLRPAVSKSYCRNFLLLLLILCINDFAFSNNQSCIKINISDSLEISKFSIWINDGINKHDLNVKENTIWCGEVFSTFGFIAIRYQYDSSQHSVLMRRFFFKKTGATINLSKPLNQDTFSINKELSNGIYSYEFMEPSYNLIVKPEEDKYFNFIQNNLQNFNNNLSLLQKGGQLSDSLKYRLFYYVQKHPESYLSFWIFQNDIAKSSFWSPDTLLNLYKILPEKFKKSKAADYTMNLLLEKAKTGYNKLFPEFKLTDINNNTLSQRELRGNFILLQFWASWCVPCLNEMPGIRKISEKYNGQKLKIISISIDNDFTSFKKAIEKHNMTWHQVFGDKKLYEKIGYAPIPQLFLLDQNGKVIYNNILSKDPNLSLLNKTLSKFLDK